MTPGEPAAVADRVCVVVPTVGRPSLPAAVTSALTQDPAPLEVLVVVDAARDPTGPLGPVAPLLAGLGADPRVTVIWTGGGAGPGGARAAGARLARGDLVAFLDDDDEWCPGKLAAQLAAWQAAAGRTRFPVVTCRAAVIGPDDTFHGVQPRAVYDGTRPLADYLFRRRDVRGLGFALGASTLLCARELLELVPFDPDLRLHEDWDWVLRATARPDCRLVMIPQVGIRYRLSPPRASASRPAAGWRTGRALVDRWGLSGRTRGDFLLGIPAGIALECGERRAAALIAWDAVRGGRPGAAAWRAFLLQLAVPPGLIRRVGRLLAAPAPARAGAGGHRPVEGPSADRADLIAP